MIPERKSILPSTSIQKWKILNFLDAGANSEAFLATDPENEGTVVLKISKLSQSSALKREATLLKSLSNEHLIGFRDYKESIEIDVSNKKTMKIALLALEYAENKELLSLIQQKGHFPEKLARTYFHQIIEALAFLHKNNIAHRDIKPENLLLDCNYCIKLADFGFAEKFVQDEKSCKIVGTPTYFPPEMHERLPHSPQSADLFAAGMILFIMVCGYMPFETARQTDKAYRILVRKEIDKFWNFHEGVMKEQDSSWKFNQHMKDLLTKVWDVDPEKRPSLEEVQSHYWMQGEVIENALIKESVLELA